ncbi:MAG TPA: hypothetical protein VJ785_13855 [Anaerolineales bacterium]|nr:hypothetical protein [Anaerolineales bacterium]
MEKNESRPFWLTIIVFTFIFSLYAALSTSSRSNEAGIILQRSIWGGMLLVYSAVSVICIWLFVQVARSGNLPFAIPSFFKRFRFDSAFWRAAGLIVFILILFIIPYVKFSFQIGQSVKKPLYEFDPIMLLVLYYWMCWWLVLFAMTALKIAFKTSWQAGFACATVILGVAYEVLIRFNLVTTYPLSMGWSEGSRYYYGSLYFSNWIYGETFPLSTLHPTRYLLQSIPFLIPSLGIPAHRFWQFLLWIVLTGGAAIVLARRAISPTEKAFKWLLAGWYFLYLLRVGVYYHLEVMVILPLVFVSKKHPWRSLIAVIAASLWAGVSRVNWFPLPVMIAIAIYLFETTMHEIPALSFRRLMKYLTQPAVWLIAGLASALIAQAMYIPLSGNAGNAEAFASSFSSALLWYRLWPNESYLLGVVGGILIVTGPLLVILIIAARRQWREIHPLRWLGLFSMIFVLFAGSLVVSAKIGGGGDLHNMDAYAVLLGIVAVFFVGGSVQTENDKQTAVVRPWAVFTYALVMPLFFLIPMLSPYPKFNQGASQAAHRQLVETVNHLGKNGPVLFINERQLVSFGDVDVPLVPEYEVVTLMEMAMSANQPYLDQFYSDLASHRFAAIVATKQNRGIRETGPLVEENNVWNTRISPYILCYYEPVLRIDAEISNLEVYVPALNSSNCPGGTP